MATGSWQPKAVRVATIVILLLLVTCSFKSQQQKQTAATTSLPYMTSLDPSNQQATGQADIAAAQIKGRRLMAAGDINQNPQPDYPSSLLTIQMALVSVKGALGFARSTWQPPGASTPGHAPAGMLPTSLPQPAGGRPNFACPTSAKPSQRLTRLHVIKPASSTANPRSLSLGQLGQQQQPSQVELSVLEGATMHLNLGLLGIELHAKSARLTPTRLKVQWTRNGQSINGARFGSLRLINRQDQVEHSTARSQVTLSDQFASAEHTSRQPLLSRSQSAQSASPANSAPHSHSTSHDSAEPYLLDPYLDKRLAASRGISTSPGVLLDDFLSDGRNIDWPRLESYLHSKLGLNGTSDESETGSDGSCVVSKQLSVIQVTMADISQEDVGFYEASICLVTLYQGEGASEIEDASQCQPAANFFLKPVEDVPQLELQAPQSSLLDPGDRMSIKCEASGFTLPQITWFLDGWRLSEHSFGSSKLVETSTYTSLAESPADDFAEAQEEPVEPTGRAAWQASRLRIGDYVSQLDQHVHSFVNSSHLEASDGGFYKCLANNGRRQIEREIRIDVRGPPSVSRRLLNRNVLAGSSQVHIQCPYSGYPIAAVEWYFRNVANQHEIQRQQVRARSKRRPDSDHDLDTDRDEWLSQAGSITAAPDEEPPPELLTDYPAVEGAIRLPSEEESKANGGEDDLVEESDYSDLDINFGSLDESQQDSRLTKRDIAMASGPDEEASWIKLPQGRHHQVHPNGTLILQNLQRSDQGYYKCRVLALPSGGQELTGSSNHFYLSVLIAPVISPFASAESLREGMRNFLTCSVIEGDSPIRLSWLKDGRPIEAHIAEVDLNTLEPNGQARIRVETSNEYTSTLYFSRVEYKDNGNYTCTAANKAASVNYTAKMLVNVPPKWTRVPKDVECVAGQSIVIDCQAQAHPNPRIWWEVGLPSASGLDSSNRQMTQGVKEVKVPTIPTSGQITGNSLQYNHHHHHHYQPQQQQQSAPNHYRTIISNSRIHILENASLVIREVSRADQGYYLCQAANNHGSLSSLIYLKVNVAASFANKFQTKHVRLLDHLELDCDPAGQSPIEIVWLKRPLGSLGANQTGSSLQTATRHLAGFNDNLSRRLFAAQLRTDLGPESLSSSISDSQQSQFSSDESMSFHFHTFRRSLNDDVRSEMIRLTIDQVRRQHSAEYICRASNQYGSDEKVTRLLVQEPPEPVQEINVVQVESRSATLSWLPPFNGNSPITSYLVEWFQIQPPASNREKLSETNTKTAKWSQIVVQQASASIGPLLPMTNYEVRVRAQNQFGISPLQHASSSTGFGLVSTLEEPPSSPPSDIRAIALSSSSIQLSWTPPKSNLDGDTLTTSRFTIKGYYLGYRPTASNESYIFKTVSLSGVTQEDFNLKPFNGHLIAFTEAHQQHNKSAYPIDFAKNTTANLESAKSRLKVLIEDLHRSTKYMIIVQAFNSAGPGPQSDPIETRTLLDDPPPAPLVRFGLVTYTSIELQWSFLSQNVIDTPNKPLVMDQQVALSTIDGYLLYYRRTLSLNNDVVESSWLEKRLTPETHALLPSSSIGQSAQGSKLPEYSLVERNSVVNIDGLTESLHARKPGQPFNSNSSLAHKSFRFLLDQLSCGSPYQIYLVAYNSIGTGQPSQILRTKTRGSTPLAPRKHDYIAQINSTMVQLNFDAWQDGGCSIINYQVKYKQVSTPIPDLVISDTNLLDQVQKPTDGHMNTPTDHLQWILVSSNISPDQQSLEVRDLKPETWYIVATRAESAAGKTEVHFSFMTLDRFGQISIRSLESAASNLPSFFKSSSSSVVLRSLLSNFTSASGHLSPLVVGTCVCLIIFIACSVFLLRRNQLNSSDIMRDINRHQHNRDICGDELNKHDLTNLASFDAQGHYESRHYHGTDHLHMQLAQSSPMAKQGVSSSSPHSMQHEHFSANGSSPCKTTTTVVTNSTSSTDSNSRADTQDRMLRQPGYQTINEGQASARFSDLNCHASDDYCLSPRALLCGSPAKFATLTRDLTLNSNDVQVARFRTLPHPSTLVRPIGTFLANNQPRIICQHQHDTSQTAHDCNLNLDHTQQLYSKLKLMCNSNSQYNLLRDGQFSADNQAPKLHHAQELCNRNIQVNLNDLVNQHELVVDACHDEHDQCFKNHPSSYPTSNHQVDGMLNQSTGAENSFHNCQRTQQHVSSSTSRDDSNRTVSFSCNRANYLEQQQPESVSYLGFSGVLGSLSSGSTTTYAANSSSQKSSNFQVTDDAEEQQLVDVAIGNQNNGTSQTQCSTNLKVSKPFHNGGCSIGLLTSSSGVQPSQLNSTGTQGQPSNEQSDYALPFPPKWV